MGGKEMQKGKHTVDWLQHPLGEFAESSAAYAHSNGLMNQGDTPKDELSVSQK